MEIRKICIFLSFLLLIELSYGVELQIQKVSDNGIDLLDDIDAESQLKLKSLQMLESQYYNLKSINASEFCLYCVDFLEETLDTLMEVLVDAGMIHGCNSICSQMDLQFEKAVCTVFCNVISVAEFVQIVEHNDPDPIFVCQLWRMCLHTDNGAANITLAAVEPKSGVRGQTFTFLVEYLVLNRTSAGYIEYTIYPPMGYPIGGSEFTEGQEPGKYSVGWKFSTNINDKQQAWLPGTYEVEFSVCDGDCSSEHQWGGVYSESKTSFKIVS